MYEDNAALEYWTYFFNLTHVKGGTEKMKAISISTVAIKLILTQHGRLKFAIPPYRSNFLVK